MHDCHGTKRTQVLPLPVNGGVYRAQVLVRDTVMTVNARGGDGGIGEVAGPVAVSRQLTRGKHTSC